MVPTNPQPQQLERLLSRRETAALLGVAEQTLAVWHSTHRYLLPCVKVGRLAKYRTSDIAAFIAANVHGSAKHDAI